MAWTISASGTKTATVAGSVSVSSASPGVFTIANSAVAGDMVILGGTTAPTGTTLGTVYYVAVYGLSSSAFCLCDTYAHAIACSTSNGTGIINTSSTGTAVTAAVGHILAIDESHVGTFVFEIDTSAMVLGDLVQGMVQNVTLSGGAYATAWANYWQHPQVSNHKLFPPVESDIGIRVALWQLAGTARAFPWKLTYI